MAVKDALEKRLTELRRAEDQRKAAKVAALQADFKADEVSLDTVNGAEVAILDSQYVVLEVHPKRESPKASHVSGPGQGEYTPGRRMLVGSYLRNGSPRLTGMPVQDLDEMAALALLKGNEFDDMTRTLEGVLAVEDETFWYNALNN